MIFNVRVFLRGTGVEAGGDFLGVALFDFGDDLLGGFVAIGRSAWMNGLVDRWIIGWVIV